MQNATNDDARKLKTVQASNFRNCW